MDTITLLTFLGGGSLAATLIIQLAKKLWADVETRYGSLVTQLALLIVSAVIAVAMWYMQFLPANFVENAGIIFAGAITLYDVFYKAIVQQALMGKKG